MDKKACNNCGKLNNLSREYCYMCGEALMDSQVVRKVNINNFNIVNYFTWLCIIIEVLSLTGAFILLLQGEVLIAFACAIGSIFVFLAVYLFALMAESIFEINRKIK